ncbi:sugar O-acyltransferase, sialic acid O-acetyltransferase NeuD family [Tistlia consotensis]|uniref:Sugar O-acyltransferase, sialic acid O-acetyltransferase NeuD family n=1 Tax=Tistlia consotensis USBA 355 TaxID=560819 RepID=A0A1Y6BJE1_9PROT|nr:NeuD/PglB/VioB family sugar acetyltransferase [Tistlia consotensis]SMF13416.1 sugar O-acyltransferase, sialic acid O-acetyltransferase NeuD family [Tistlia consotensis USBA 355]SNR50506.1 sugar O-acyltransferase, sialic acid O-acetyltransferase NeuD family [Tistlia consotensis]
MSGAADGRPIVIIGTGEGRCVLETCRDLGLAVAGFLDTRRPAGEIVNDCPVLGGEALLDDPAFVAAHRFAPSVGEGGRRLAYAARVERLGGGLATLVHPSNRVSLYAEIGAGSILLGKSVVNPNASLGRCVLVDWDCTIGHDDRLGDGVFLAPGCHLGGRVVCEAECFLGLGAIVVPDVRIGARSVVGAGSTVTRDLPADVVALGNPAKVVKRRERAA